MKKISTLLFLTILSYGLIAGPAIGATAEELRKALEDKAKAALELENQKQALNKQLNATLGQKKSLQTELKKIDYSVNQLNLGIKSSQINIEKLSLELQSTQLDINQINGAISTKKAAVIGLVRELYEKDRKGLLALILKNKSLADSVLESQSITNLNSGLALELQNLHALNEQLDTKIKNTSSKKQAIEAENQNLKNRRSIITDQKTERQNLLAETKNQEKLYAQLIDNLAKQQAQISDEIESIEKELRANIDPSLLPIARPGVLALPADGPITQEYGFTAFARNGYRGHFHNGVDIGAPFGSNVTAAEDGTVVAVGNQDQYCYKAAYGKFIVVQHDNNLTTLYAHLSGQAVQKGDKVKRGQVIGYIGRTGYATGPHLHLTVYAGPTFYMGPSRSCGPMPFGGDLDPIKYLAK